MRHLRHSGMRIVGVVACVLLATARAAFAGGPLIVDSATGTPYSWQPAASYNVETGPLNSTIDNAAALAAVVASFGAWEGVPTSTLTFANAGSLGADVDETNIFTFLGVFDGLSPIVFDNDGNLFAALGLPPGVLGIASPEFVTIGPPFAILEGFALLNGFAFADLDEAKSTMVHEFGHFINLAHSVVNGQALLFGDQTGPTPFDPLGFGPPPLNSVETMYPFAVPGTDVFAQTPHADDIAALSTIYPAAGFPGSAGTITGNIRRSDGVTGIIGVNVIARKADDPF